MTRTLVTYASRMGGTEGIARAIADEMQRAGIDVDLRPAADVRSVTGYDAVVLGSAVYAGRWLRPARTLLKRLVASRPPADPGCWCPTSPRTCRWTHSRPSCRTCDAAPRLLPPRAGDAGVFLSLASARPGVPPPVSAAACAAPRPAGSPRR